MKHSLFLALASVAGLWSQQPVPSAATAPSNASGGLTTEWDIQKTIHAVGAHAQRLVPLLEDVQPGGWLEKGAPDAYVAQLKALKSELGYASRTANELQREAGDLGKAFELFMRLDASRGMFRSIVQGVRTYQNPALADLLESVELEGDVPLSRFRNYLVELATMKERELKIIDQEAQRCRGMLIRQPVRRPASRPNAVAPAPTPPAKPPAVGPQPAAPVSTPPAPAGQPATKPPAAVPPAKGPKP